MVISRLLLSLYILIAVLGGFALGAWIQRIFVWYPFGLHPMTGKEAMLGKEATITMVKPNYMEVRFDSQIWKARPFSPMELKPGEKVVIRDVTSNTLVVEPETKAMVSGSKL